MKIGDVVAFKTGSPKMLVLDTFKPYPKNPCIVIQCGWFDTMGLYHEGPFNEDTLTIV